MVANSLPNLFVIGAPKCGTTALVEALSQHPRVHVPKKEIRYFDARTFYDFAEDAPVRTIDQYLAHFDSKAARQAALRVDGSVFNMYDAGSIQDILALNPNARFLVVLRNPLDAAKSMHQQRLKYSQEGMRELSDSFSDCWRLLDARRAGNGFPKGCRNRFLFRYDLLYRYELYLPFIERLVSSNQLTVVDYSQLDARPGEVFDALWSRLGLEPFPVQITRANESRIVTPNLLSRSRELLIRHSGAFRHILDSAGLPVTRIGKRLALRKSPPRERERSSDVDTEAAEFFGRSQAAMVAAFARFPLIKPAT